MLCADQIQSGVIFKTPLEIGLGDIVQTVMWTRKTSNSGFPMRAPPKEIASDLNTKLLFEDEIKGK